MYRAKSLGKARYERYSMSSMRARVIWHALQLEMVRIYAVRA